MFVIFWEQVIRGITTSGVVWFYFLFTLICGAPALYNHIHGHSLQIDECSLFTLYYFVAIFIFLVICFADRLPQKEKESQKECPKQSASFVSRLTFSWFTPLVILGWRQPLTLSDLWRVRNEDKSSNIYSVFDKHWKSFHTKCVSKSTVIPIDAINRTDLNPKQNKYTINGFPSEKSTKSPEPGVVSTICKTFWLYFLGGCLFKLINDILTLINPQIMKYFITVFEIIFKINFFSQDFY